MRRALQQAQRLGAEILVTRSITRIDPRTRHVYLDGGDVLRTKTIILACGVSWRQLSVEGFDTLVGKGVQGAARSEAPSTHGLDVHVVGSGNSAGQAALFFSSHARSVTMLCRGDSLDKSKGSGMARYLADQLEFEVELRGAVPDGSGGSSRDRITRRDRRAQLRDGGRDAAGIGGLFLFIGAMPRRPGCRRRSPSTTTGTCSPVRTCPATPTGSSNAIPTFWRRASRNPRVRRRSIGAREGVASAVGEGSMAIAFVQRFVMDAESEALTGTAARATEIR